MPLSVPPVAESWAPPLSPEGLSSPLARPGGPGLETVHFPAVDMASPIRTWHGGPPVAILAPPDRPAGPPPAPAHDAAAAAEVRGRGEGEGAWRGPRPEDAETAQLAARAAQLEAAVRRLEALRDAAAGSGAWQAGIPARPVLVAGRA
jgi:hypothetical protein